MILKHLLTVDTTTFQSHHLFPPVTTTMRKIQIFEKKKTSRRSSQRAVNENPHKFSKILNLIKKTLMIIFSTVTRFQNPYLIVLVLNHLKIYNSIVVTRATRRRRRASFFRSVNDSPAAKLHIRRRSSHRPFSFSAFSHHCVSVTLKSPRERER